MCRIVSSLLLSLALCACGEPTDKTDDTAAPVSRDGTYTGTMMLHMTGGGGEGSCQVEVSLGVLVDGEPGVSGSGCCPVQGLSTHGDVDICVQYAGAVDGEEAVSGALIASEQGEDGGGPNGTFEGGFEDDDTLVASGSGAMDHDMGSTSFELSYDIEIDLARD